MEVSRFISGSRVQNLSSHVEFFYFMYYVYILYSSGADRYYVGHCENAELRLCRHNARGVPSTKPYCPWELKYTESFENRALASAREKEIKQKKSRRYIEFLVNNGGGTDRHVPM